jgi:alpha-amylase/alpha-mannosidase (GH57 family)
MASITLSLIVHDHQPVGNFDGVIRAACEDAYDPFLGFLERHPRFRLAMHMSGPLLEWLAAHRREHLTRLRALVDRGQVEPWGGAFFEPVLPGIPEIDRQGQIRRMSDWIEEELGVRPRGLWLAERVWEPALAATLARAGAEYTAVDDTHFLSAGLEREQLWGPYLTEDEGERLRVLPIRRELRYLIPFERPERTVEWLKTSAAIAPGRLAVLGDDGEKFGLWPGTRELCWKERWLDRLADALEAERGIEMVPPGEALENHPALGLAYLPSASYHEMEEWSLPPSAQRRFRAVLPAIEPVFGEQARDLARGGHWRGFQMRYPESNRLHKRMLRASRRLHAVPPERNPAWREAQLHLWRSQCNCPYWHGVFGGLYLPHLREAVYRELIAVERYLCTAPPHLEHGDFDLDGFDDALLETREWAAWVSARGGALWAFDDRRGARNWGDTLARRDEPYHDALEHGPVGGGEGASIHDAIRVTESGLDELARRTDPGPRDSFIERWTEGTHSHDWNAERFEVLDAPAHEILLRSPGAAITHRPPALEKRYRIGRGGGLEAELALRSDRERNGVLEVALHLGVHVPEAADRWVEVNGARSECPAFASRAQHRDVLALSLVDRWEGVRLDVAIDRPASLAREPIETVSLSERGAEKVFQGLAARFSFDVKLKPDVPWMVRFTMTPRAAGAA